MWIVFHYEQMLIEVFRVVHKLYWNLILGVSICICFKQVLNLTEIIIIYDIETNKLTPYIILYTPYTSYMRRSLTWPSLGMCITKERYVEILQKFFNQCTDIKY